METLFVIVWIILHLNAALSDDVCREVEGVAVTSCDDGFYCCENDRKCCSSAALGVPAIVAIVIGVVLFIAIVIAFVLLCRKPPSRKTIDNDNPAQEIEMVCRASMELPPPYILDAYKMSPLPASFLVQPPPYELEASTDIRDICDNDSKAVDSFHTLPAERCDGSCYLNPAEVPSSNDPPTYNETIVQAYTAGREQSCTASIEQPCTASIEQTCNASIEQPCTASIEHACTTSIEQPCTAIIEQPCNAIIEQPCTASIEQPCNAIIQQTCAAIIEQPCAAIIEQPRDAIIEQECTATIEQACTANIEIRTRGEEQDRTEESLSVVNNLGLQLQETTVSVSNTTSGELCNVLLT